MTQRSVYWHEGMFLWPQHMQLAERYLSHKQHIGHKWNLHYNWGLRRIDFDEEALATHRFVVRSLEARLRDGTLVALPDQGKLPALDLKAALAKTQTVLVYLAVPVLHLGRPNVFDADNPQMVGDAPVNPAQVRYHVESIELEDENTGDEPQPTTVRLLNAKLLAGKEEQAGYEVLPLARIAKSDKGVCALDVYYIPPLLGCDGWKPLQVDILQAIYSLLGRKLEVLANQIITRDVTFDSRNPGDALLLAQLQSLNESFALWNVLAFAEGVHPFPAYTELCRVVGKLAIFGDSRQVPELPRYDHDDLGTCFYRVKQYIESIQITEPTYEERPFIGEDKRIQVTLEPKWLEPAWDMYVGVQSPLKAEDCIRLLTRQGLLDMKIGSSERVDKIFADAKLGLEFTPSPKPPRALPARPDLIYFQINRAHNEEWDNVRNSLTLAIRLNDRRIEGSSIQGKRTLPIRTDSRGSQISEFQFTLFLLQKSS